MVPIRFKGKAIGEIDIDSDLKNAFSTEDEKFVEQVAEIIEPVVNYLYTS